MDILICLIAFHCLSSTFHCYLTSDPDYLRGADQFPDYFPGLGSLCLDPVPDSRCFPDLCHRSRIPILCLLMCDLRSAHNPCFPRPIQSFRVLLVTRTQRVHCPGARPIDRIPGVYSLASAQTVQRSYYINMGPAYSDMPAASIGRSPRSDAGHPVPDQADFSGQPLDLPTNPASMEAGLRQACCLSACSCSFMPRDKGGIGRTHSQNRYQTVCKLYAYCFGLSIVWQTLRTICTFCKLFAKLY
jgi:hypothetical protein